MSTKKKTFSFIYIPDVPEQPVTNFNGDGGEHSQTEKRRVEGHRVVKAPKELVSCHINANIPEVSEIVRL